MLYNKRWDKTDPLTLDGLIKWLKMQHPKGGYNFHSAGTCLLDQYIKYATGKSGYSGHLHFKICGGDDQYMKIAGEKPWTFGAALKRAKAVRKQSA